MRILLFMVLALLAPAQVQPTDPALPGLEIQPLEQDVFLHTSYQFVEGFGLVDSNGLVVVDGKNAYLVDTPWSARDTEQLVNWIQRRGLTLRASVSTHFHEDRTAGIQWLNSQSIPTYASDMTNRLLQKAGRAQARHSFSKADYVWVKDQIEIFHPGAGHSPDNVVVWLPRHKLLFGGCFVRAKETESLGNLGDAVVSQWPASARLLQSKYGNARRVVPGHGEVGDASLLAHTRKLAEAAAQKAAPARQGVLDK